MFVVETKKLYGLSDYFNKRDANMFNSPL